MGSLGNCEITRNKAMWLYPYVLGFNPSKRWGHSACFSHGFLYVFGGCCGGMHFDDILVLNLNTMSCTSLVTTGNGPGPRDSHSAVIVGHKMIVFGGTNGTKKVNDVHVLDLRTKEWTSPECRGTPPSPRESHTATLVGDDELVIFGGSGEGGSNYLNDMHVLDLKTMTWKSPELKGNLPIPRDSHGAFAIGKKLFVYGGDCGDRYHGGVDMLDMEAQTWSMVRVQGLSPGARAGHATVGIGSKVYIVGGVGDKRYYNDVWVLDVTTCSWTQVEICGQKPQGRFSHVAIVADTDIVVYGGCGEDERPLDELLVLQLGPDHPNGRYNVSMCRMFGKHLNQEKRRLRNESENYTKNMICTNGIELNRLNPKRKRVKNSKVRIASEQEEHSLTLSQHSSPSQSDQTVYQNIMQRTSSEHHFLGEHQFTKQFHGAVEQKSVQNLIGAEVRGKVDAKFDSGFLMTATVNGMIFRGVLFPSASEFDTRGSTFDQTSSTSHFGISRSFPNSYHVDSTQANQVTRPSPVYRNSPSSKKEAKAIRSDLQGVVLSLGGPRSDHGVS